MNKSMFIKSITTDDQNRVIVAVQEQFQNYLKDDATKKLLRETAVKALGEDFIQLEVSTSTFRVTVAEGKSEHAITVIEEEIGKAIEMAMMFMNQFNQKED